MDYWESVLVDCGMVKFKRTTFYIFLALFLLLFPFSQARADAYLTVIFLDVGEGDAIYLETPTTERLLVDTGNPMTGYRVVDFLKDKGIKTLDAIFITHPHLDHMGGIFQIIPRFDVKALYDNGQPIPENPDCDIYRWYKEVIREGNYKPIVAGDFFQYGDVRIQVLWPRDPTSSNWNVNSLVLKVTYGRVAFLFMGDANTDVEEALLNKGIDLKANLLKVGHHGAIDATSERFLKAVSPKFAVISADAKNIKGYPHPDVLSRLKKYRVKIFTTFSHGNLTFWTDGINGVFLRNDTDNYSEMVYGTASFLIERY